MSNKKKKYCKNCNLDFSKTNEKPNSNGLCQACEVNKNMEGIGSFVIDTCSECKKVKSIVKTGYLTDKELEKKINETKARNDWCEGNCQTQWSSSSHSTQNKSISSSQNSQIGRERESNSGSKNYLPWILGGIGVVSLVGIAVYFATRKGENK